MFLCYFFRFMGALHAWVRYLFIISTSVIDCLGRFVPEMTYYVSSGTLNLTQLNSNSLSSERLAFWMLPWRHTFRWFTVEDCLVYYILPIVVLNWRTLFFCTLWLIWCSLTVLRTGIGIVMLRRSVRIQDNELRDLAEKIRQANQLKEREDSELPVVSEQSD